MDAENPSVPRADDQQRAGMPAREPGLIASLGVLWEDLRGLVHDHLRLAALEMQQAAQSMVDTIVYGVCAGVAIGVLLASAWLGASIALALWLIERGLPASAALLLAAMLNLLGALGFVLAIRRRSRQFLFAATLRNIGPSRENTAAAGRTP